MEKTGEEIGDLTLSEAPATACNSLQVGFESCGDACWSVRRQPLRGFSAGNPASRIHLFSERALRHGKAGEQTAESAYPATNGRAGGKLPAGNRANRSPDWSFADASRKAATNHA